ncbi:MAG TPA: ribosomal-protein-alanine N-acetyltransferase [Gammaproteobacteria bacterium]|nr:ribosomal-protein-alanine N-acetyltransferase [Gammaproteobacteria bacterium]
MRVDDLKEVAALEQATSPAPWSPGIFLDCLRAGHDCWVLRADRVVGFAIASLGAGEVHLLNLVVTPSKQGLGFGGRLLRKVIGMARTNGAERIFLEVRPSNIRAQAIYQRAGFKLLSRRPKYYGQPQQEDALVYTLVI